MVDTIHDTIIAFLQTSEFGTWDVDDTQPNNQFKLHFIRGNWGRSFFGLGSKRAPRYIEYDSQGKFIPRTKPMLLELAIRPSPHDLSISIRHSVFTKGALSLNLAYWQQEVRGEIDALRHYLEKCYGLDELPRIEP
jgi:carotenoid cleavage dioxygenase-like enzyme